jgi:hypothetical protein
VPQFLTDEWIAEARRIHDEHDVEGPTPPAVKINLVVTEVPFGDGVVNAHMDSSSGEVEIELGHLDDAETTLTTDYETARSTFVDNDPQAGMQAFMQGKVKVQGDMTKLMVMAQGGGDPDLNRKIQAITD